MVFSNLLLVFMISLQFGMYGLMIDNYAARSSAGHMQVQAPGYNDDQKMRQVVPDVVPDSRPQPALRDSAATKSRREAGHSVSPRVRSAVTASPSTASNRTSSRSCRTSRALFQRVGSSSDANAPEIVIGSATLARNLRVTVGDELTLLGSGVDGSFAAAVLTIVGIFDSGVQGPIDRNIAEMPLGAFQETFYMNGAGHQVVFCSPIRCAMSKPAKPRVEGIVAQG